MTSVGMARTEIGGKIGSKHIVWAFWNSNSIVRRKQSPLVPLSRVSIRDLFVISIQQLETI